MQRVCESASLRVCDAASLRGREAELPRYSISAELLTALQRRQK